MSWQRIVLPLISNGTDPNVVELGKLALEVFERENKPAGFGMFHASEGTDKFIVYYTPVAAELCNNIPERFTLEPCDTPNNNDPCIAFVIGDPRAMGLLKGVYQAQSA
jgi:hypothetical protein